MICDNLKCEYHIPVPECLPENVPSVRLAVSRKRMGLPPPYGSTRTEIIERYLYRREPGHITWYLCAKCHNEIRVKINSEEDGDE